MFEIGEFFRKIVARGQLLIGQKFIEIAKIINFDEKYCEMRLFLVIFKRLYV